MSHKANQHQSQIDKIFQRKPQQLNLNKKKNHMNINELFKSASHQYQPTIRHQSRKQTQQQTQSLFHNLSNTNVTNQPQLNKQESLPLSNNKVKHQYQKDNQKILDTNTQTKVKTKVNYLTVYDLDKELHHDFKNNKLFNNFYITGGVSGIKKYKWAWYFTLDDPKHKKVSMSAELPRKIFDNLPFNFQNGMNVDIVAGLAMSRRYGSVQIKVKKILPAGISSLYLRAEQTKKELAKAGYFNSAHKKPIPKFPRRVAVITSSVGAVIRDIIDTIRGRFPTVQVVLFPTAVSGSRAPKEMIKQIHHVDEIGNFDSAIIGRGGGSKKDLQTFNNKDLAIAIYNCKTPIISSVGHGIDTEFITNYVADAQRDTPTAAADCATPVRMIDLCNTLAQWKQLIISAMKKQLVEYKNTLQLLKNATIYTNPQHIQKEYQQQLDNVITNFKNALINQFNTEKQTFVTVQNKFNQCDLRAVISKDKSQVQLIKQELYSALNNTLYNKKNTLMQNASNFKQINILQIMQDYQKSLRLIAQRFQSVFYNQMQQKKYELDKVAHVYQQISPKHTLKRGYSYTTNNHKIVKNATDVKTGDKIKVQFYKGHIIAKVTRRFNK